MFATAPKRVFFNIYSFLVFNVVFQNSKIFTENFTELKVPHHTEVIRGIITITYLSV